MTTPRQQVTPEATVTPRYDQVDEDGGGTRRKVETPQYTLVGNAVPPLLSYAIAKQVMEAIRNE